MFPARLTPLSATTTPISIDSPLIRQAGADVLSLALIDARNHSLHLVSEIERSLPGLATSAEMASAHAHEMSRVLDWPQHAETFGTRLPLAAQRLGIYRAQSRCLL
jgi:hypothetical protein